MALMQIIGWLAFVAAGLSSSSEGLTALLPIDSP